MAYQPLYGRVSDNQGILGHTSSLRGRVDHVSFWLNSWFGEVLNLNARLVDGQKIVQRPDLRKIKKGQRSAALKEYEEEVNKENRVVVNIDIPASEKFEIRINGITIPYERLKMTENMKFQGMDRQIETLKDLAVKETQIQKIIGVMRDE